MLDKLIDRWWLKDDDDDDDRHIRMNRWVMGWLANGWMEGWMDGQTNRHCCLSQLWLGSSPLGLFFGKWAHARGTTRGAALSRPEAGVPVPTAHGWPLLLTHCLNTLWGCNTNGFRGQRMKSHRATKCLPTGECGPKCVPDPLWNATILAKEGRSGEAWKPYSLGHKPITKG